MGAAGGAEDEANLASILGGGLGALGEGRGPFRRSVQQCLATFR